MTGWPGESSGSGETETAEHFACRWPKYADLRVDLDCLRQVLDLAGSAHASRLRDVVWHRSAITAHRLFLNCSTRDPASWPSDERHWISRACFAGKTRHSAWC